MNRAILATFPALLLAGCNMAPAYRPPTTVAIPASFKEDPQWAPATPSDAAARGDWWALFAHPATNQRTPRRCGS